ASTGSTSAAWVAPLPVGEVVRDAVRMRTGRGNVHRTRASAAGRRRGSLGRVSSKRRQPTPHGCAMDSPPHSPRWIVAGAVLLAAGYLPTVATPFDFVDDGNLVYPTPQPTLAAHASLWWDKVQANYEHLGP